ncbi:four helix bundle protein [Mucilaginibacter sp. BJC16-A38]|uniref:four helix bundle protein n=1 Tax=Mucilaginibacter phenanthrenivorans TaxID=1234842 RepID=UPI002157DEFD|nr:four helix bundle protein [Mucilaginibacter phenanthrenivorans]MCR8560555.1 four helix bundle protein [Mucilaginibacter phenanthrenivorans]
MASFTELETWKQARKIRNMVSALVKTFPSEEKYRLNDQIIRCSRSIGNNIAEGHGRFHYQDNIHFCIIARGSLSETLDHMIVALDEKLIPEDFLQSFQIEYDQCLKLLNGYIQFIKRKKNNELD